ncbi:alpha/beta fold hydrolase [Rhodococcus sp. NPDC057014]|uniref:alpha/beta fold hydrolase n=1 Tax=Rhodococcus sp. NPDC057014 TaxID=3346000 RepID=UPI00363E2214
MLYRWLRAVLDAVDARGGAVIGHSLGGRVGLELALRDPDAVSGLVLLCPAMAFRRRRPTALARVFPVDLARLPLVVPPALLHTAARAGLRALFADPESVPRHWYRAAADEWELSLRHAARRRALGSALLGLYLDEPLRGDRTLGSDRGPATADTVPLGRRRQPRASRLRPPRHRHRPHRHNGDPAELRARSQFEQPATTLRLIREHLSTAPWKPPPGPAAIAATEHPGTASAPINRREHRPHGLKPPGTNRTHAPGAVPLSLRAEFISRRPVPVRDNGSTS